MKKFAKRILLVLSVAAFMGLLFTGCQATKGLGKDVENLGENIQGD
jgi:predicted small secreted protein